MFKKHFPNYKKNNPNIFSELEEKVQVACINAKNNPHTNANELVEYLQNIKK